MPKTIYLDYNATTPVCKEAIEASTTAMKDAWANPSSGHLAGQMARRLLEGARRAVAGLVGAGQKQIVFTSGGTESNNLAILGVARALEEKGRHLITSAIEHPSVLNVFKALERQGWQVSIVPVDAEGLVQPESFRAALRPDTTLASIMLANNETGAIQPIAELAAIAREKGVVFHTDACQAIGKIQVDVDRLGVDLLTLAGHKFYAPKGTGALYIRQGVQIEPILYGAGQEGGLRPGTEPVPQAAALGAAAEAALKGLKNGEPDRLKGLSDRLLSLLRRGWPGLLRHGPEGACLPNTLYVAFAGLDANEILKRAPLLLASTGAACHDRSCSISHVLAAMGVDQAAARGTIRLSVGRHTTAEEIEEAADMLLTAAKQVAREA